MKKYITSLFILIILLIPLESKAFIKKGQCFYLYNDMSLGSNGLDDMRDEVSYLQKFLQIHGYSKLNPTGYFGKSTVSSVKKFQRKEKLKVTGKANKETRERIQKISGCKEGQVFITSVNGPASHGFDIYTGGNFQIIGGGFSSDVKVYVDNTLVTPLAVRNEAISLKLSEDFKKGDYDVQVVSKNNKSNTVKVKILESFKKPIILKIQSKANPDNHIKRGEKATIFVKDLSDKNVSLGLVGKAYDIHNINPIEKNKDSISFYVPDILESGYFDLTVINDTFWESESVKVYIER